MLPPALLLGALGLALLLLPLWPRLLLTDGQGRILRSYPAAVGECEVFYRHSVNKGLVVERFAFDAGQGELWLTTGLFENFGAGMMDTVPDGIQHGFEEGFVRLDFPKNPQPVLRFIPGGEAKQTFRYGGEEVALYELAYHRTVELHTGRYPAWRLWLSRIRVAA